jgi:predicted nucleic acid-binding protein
MSDFVLDASVVLALYLPATPAQRSYAENVFSLLQHGAVATVPGLFFAEVGTVLVRARRKRQISSALLTEALIDLRAFMLDEANLPYTVMDVVDASQRYMLQGYDAVYFDLAKQFQLRIATLDKGHRSACKHHGVGLLTF